MNANKENNIINIIQNHILSLAIIKKAKITETINLINCSTVLQRVSPQVFIHSHIIAISFPVHSSSTVLLFNNVNFLKYLSEIYFQDNGIESTHHQF